MMLNFPFYMKNSISKNEYLLLEKHKAQQFDIQKEGPSFSTDISGYALDIRYCFKHVSCYSINVHCF